MNEQDLRAYDRAARQVRATSSKLPPDLFRQLASYSNAQRAAIGNARPLAQGLGAVAESIRRTASAIARTAADPQVRKTVALIGQALLTIKEAMPPNWPPGVDFDRVIELSNSGIPTVWLPDADLLEKLLQLDSADAQMSLLLESGDELASGARAVIAQVTHPMLGPQLPLAASAIESWTGGHGHAAQALAVALIETVAHNHLAGDYRSPDKKIGWDKTIVKLDDPDGLLAIAQIRTRVAIAPLATFYTHWFPGSDQPMPTQLSRHAASHQAHIDHFTDSNALLSIILMASTLRATDELLWAAAAVDDEAAAVDTAVGDAGHQERG